MQHVTLDDAAQSQPDQNRLDRSQTIGIHPTHPTHLTHPTYQTYQTCQTYRALL
jgi:hypothetical protein